MLMGCRMVDNVRTISAEDILDTLGITDRSDQHYQIQCRIFTDQLLLDRIGVVLIDIDDDQLFRLMSCNLSAQLASDGPAATSNQYDLIPHIVQDFFCINLYGISS